MKSYFIPEISPNIFAVGAKDYNKVVFDALIPLPRGTSYNSYLVKGDSKNALIDAVGPGFETEIMGKISQLIDPAKLDYLIMNHAEPDHGTAIGTIMAKTNATLYATEKGASMAARFHGAPTDRIKVIKDGDKIELGGKTLRFIEAPWLHWPETMFTYLEEQKILFSCDFFGAHIAYGTYSDDVENIVSLAKSYFAEIMMPLRPFCKKGIEKVNALEVSMIAPSHGPVYRDPDKILGHYRSWIAGETKKKAVVAYVTMWNSTEEIVKVMVQALENSGIEVKLYNIINAETDLLTEDLVDARAVVIGAPTVLGSLHPLIMYNLNLIRLLKPPTKYGVVLNSYGWGKGAIKQALDVLEGAKIEIVGSLEVNGPPLSDDCEKITELGKQLAAKMT